MSIELLKRTKTFLSLINSNGNIRSGESINLYRAIEAELAKPEPEPVCFVDKTELKKVTDKIGSSGLIAKSIYLTNTSVNGKIPIYAHPPRQQNPLSDKEILKIAFENLTFSIDENDLKFAREVEKAHGIGEK